MLRYRNQNFNRLLSSSLMFCTKYNDFERYELYDYFNKTVVITNININPLA